MKRDADIASYKATPKSFEKWVRELRRIIAAAQRQRVMLSDVPYDSHNGATDSVQVTLRVNITRAVVPN